MQMKIDAQLGDIVRPVRQNRMIDISNSPFVPATQLRVKLDHLLMAGEIDGGLPILRDGVLTGMIPVPDLEFGLDVLGEQEDNTLCLMSMDTSTVIYDSDDENVYKEDFLPYIDHVSFDAVALDYSFC